MGGNFVRARVSTMMYILGEQGIVEDGIEIFNGIMSSGDKKIISKLAEGALTPEEYELLGIEDDVGLLIQEAAKRTLDQAAQLMAVKIAGLALYHIQRSDNPSEYMGENKVINVPAEGAMLWDAYGVKEKVAGELKRLLPEYNFALQESSGLLGIAQLAMVRQHQYPSV